MAFYDVSLLAADNDFISRTRACATIEGIADPMEWTNEYIWQMAATPSFGDKYQYALATGIENPGRQESVISDADILSAVQAIMNAPPA
jgi:hypothetical protein